MHNIYLQGVQEMVSRRPNVRFVALVAVGLLLLSGCTSSKKTSTSAGNSSAAGATPTTAAASGSVSNDYGLKYTGGRAGPADVTKTPITIGYVNEEGGVPGFPEATQGVQAAVDYVNKELGGVQGHKIVLEKCLVQTEQDGQKCGTQLANDPKVQVVLTGALVVGNQSLYSVLSGKEPIIIGNPITVPDFSAKGAAAFTPGAPFIAQGLAVFIAKYLKNVHTVAVIYSNNPVGTNGFNALFKPVLGKLGISNVTGVPVSDSATATDYQQALQSSGAAKADVVVPFVTQQGCIAAYDAMQALGITPTVVTTQVCYGTPMTQHLQKDLGLKNQEPDGWYFTGDGYSYFIPDAASGMTTYLAKIRQYGPPNVDYTGFAGSGFAGLLTIVKFMNAIGADKITSDAISSQIASFHGPMMLVAGPMNCGANPVFLTLCGTQMGVEQYKDLKWTAVADGLNNTAIDPTKP
jgi:branched-chain amino acid transport system substrate-binding protein